jgi:hypothetical protein
VNFKTTMLRYDVANFLNMPETSAVFTKVLEAFACDELWEVGDKLQNAYMLAGLKRYNLDHIRKTYSKSVDTEKEKELVSSSTGKDNMNAFDAVPSSSTSGLVPVKIEFPLAVEFNAQLVVLKSAKGVWT